MEEGNYNNLRRKGFVLLFCKHACTACFFLLYPPNSFLFEAFKIMIRGNNLIMFAILNTGWAGTWLLKKNHGG